MTMGMAMRTAKKQQVYISKTTTLHVHRAFLWISQPSLHDCDMKLPNYNFTHLLYGVGEHDTTQHNTTQHKIGLNCELKKKITSHPPRSAELFITYSASFNNC